MDNQEIIPREFFTDPTCYQLLGENCLPIPQNFTASQYTTDQFVKSIFYYVLKNNYEKIVFCTYVEGLNISNMFRADEIIKNLINKFKIPPEKFIMLVGCFPNQNNLDLYKQHCKKYGLIEVDLRFLNIYENSAMYDAREQNHLINNEPLGFKIKERPFLCFNGVARPHRCLLIGEIFARNLHPFTFLSSHDPDIMTRMRNSKWIVDKKIYGERFYRLFYELESRKELFPMTLSIPYGEPLHHAYTNADHDLYQKSYISVVTETDFFQTAHVLYTISFNCTFPTEKTYKPIKARHPFIIASRPHFLKHLRAQGYQTFHPHINESYDDIENDERRMNAICAEMERLSKYTENEWQNFLYHTNHFCQHNFDHLLRTELKITKL